MDVINTLRNKKLLRYFLLLPIILLSHGIIHNAEASSVNERLSMLCRIGQNTLTGRPIFLDKDTLKSHQLILGGTGRGKSKLLEHRIRIHIQNNHGLIVLDPHGFLYEDILAFATVAGYRERIVLINANDTDSSVGLNFLAPNGMDTSAHAEQVMKAISKVFGQEDGDVKPRLERWSRNLLMTLIEANLTLADMLEFLSASSPLYRQAALSYVGNDYVRMEWEGFDSITKRSERENLIEAPLNRAAKLILSDPIRRIVGQQHSTIDIGEAIERGKIILVNLAPLRVSRECQQVLGILLVDQIINYAFKRSKKNARKSFFVIVDEAAELTSNDLPYSLQALRKFGIFFTLCFQTLAQIEKIPGYYENVMTNCDVKIVFKSSRADSEKLIGELFAGHIRGDMVKAEIFRTLLIPKETVREVVSTGYSQSEGHGEVNSTSDSINDGSGSGSISSFGEGLSEQFLPGQGIFDMDLLSSHSHSTSFGTATSDFNMRSSGSSSGHSDISSRTTSESRSKSIIPFYEYIREQELSNREYYSIEEIKEKYIAWVMCQPQRHAQIKVGDNKAIPILTTFVEDVRVREKDKLKVTERSNSKYALPAHVVDKMIRDRRIALLEKHDHEVEDEEIKIESERWQ